jgi:hypothetical protein
MFPALPSSLGSADTRRASAQKALQTIQSALDRFR